MAENLVVNDVTYPEVEAISMTNEAGEKVAFYPDAVRYNPQTLTDAQKAQARTNMGAASAEEVSSLSADKLDANKLPEAINTALTQAKNSGEFDGADGRRGTGLLPVTTAPSSYTTAVNGLTPAYRIALSTVKTQASTDEVYAGDTVRYSYYHYPVIYVDASYVYCGTRVSIRGATGATYTLTDADKATIVDAVVAALPVYNGEVV